VNIVGRVSVGLCVAAAHKQNIFHEKALHCNDSSLAPPPELLNLPGNAKREPDRAGAANRMAGSAAQRIAKLTDTTDQSQASKQV